jgi:AcrR family transcriptional regulator
MTRYAPEHKEQTRRRLIESAVTAFRREGVDSAGLKEIMQELGLTVGGFYRHFSSKSDLLQSALNLGLSQSVERMRQVAAEAGCDEQSTEWIERVAQGYLSEPHRRSIAHGCILAALASEIARSDRDVKSACEAGLRKVHTEVGRHLPPGSDDLDDQLWGLLALEVGGLLLSRMVVSDEAAAQILASCRNVVETLLQADPAHRRRSATTGKRRSRRGARKATSQR